MGIEARHAYRFKFLKSEEWQFRRKAFLASRGFKCCVCGKFDFSNDVHHLQYDRNWIKTRWKFMVAMCRLHHEDFHKFQKEFPLYGYGELLAMVRERHLERTQFKRACKDRVAIDSGVERENRKYRRKAFFKIIRQLNLTIKERRVIQ